MRLEAEGGQGVSHAHTTDAPPSYATLALTSPTTDVMRAASALGRPAALPIALSIVLICGAAGPELHYAHALIGQLRSECVLVAEPVLSVRGGAS